MAAPSRLSPGPPRATATRVAAGFRPPGRWGRLARRHLRRLTNRLRPPRVLLVYHPGYERAMAGVPLDPLRADRILAFLAEEGLLRRDVISLARPAALANLLLVHTPAYLEALQRPEVMTAILGAIADAGEVEAVLDLQRLMAGGTIQASRLALATGRVAVNLGGGFHHAEADRGTGFCVFNDVAIAIARLRRRGFVEPILAVDLDLHDGNGTRALFAADRTVHTYSIHNQHWGPTEAVESTTIALGADVGDDRLLATLHETLPPLVERFRPRLAFYVAGCDVAADDRLGDWRLTPTGMLKRDRFVMELLRRHGVPVVVVLGGGYGDEAWRYSARFAAWLLTGAEIEPPSNDELTLLRFRQIKAALDPLRLTAAGNGERFELTEEDLVGIVPGIPRQTRYLGYFSKVGIELILERFGILEQLRARGFRSPTVEFELDHPVGQTLRIFGGPDRGELLVELRVNRSTRAIQGYEVLSVEWLLLQNPRETFTPRRRALPGQSHPGLGMLREFFGLLVILCETLALDGLLFTASTYHLAVLASRFVSLLDPHDDGTFRGLQHSLAELPLDEASRAVAEGQVLDGTGQSVAWRPCTMVLPVSERLRERVSGEAYEAQAAEAYAKARFRLAEPTATASASRALSP